jgi:hypothetical protein
MGAIVGVTFVGQKLNLEAARRPSVVQHSLEHHPSDTAATVVVENLHRLNEGGGTTVIGDMGHDQQ